MFLCSEASKLSNYEKLLIGEFLRINTVVILYGDVIMGNLWVVQAEMEGCKVEKKFMAVSGK